MAQIKQVGIGRKSTGTIDGITYYVRGGVTYARSTPNMPASAYNNPEAKKRQAIFKLIQMHLKYHLRTIKQTFTPKGNGSSSNRYYSVNSKSLAAALDELADQYCAGEVVTIDDVEAAISAYAAEHPKAITIASKSGYNEVHLEGEWPETITLNAKMGDSTVIIIVNEYGQQTTINADGTITTGTYEGSSGSNGSNGSSSGGNSGGNSGSSETTTVAAPQFSGETQFTESTQVTITGPDGASIYYTVDGSTPTSASSQYSSPLTFSETTTLKAIAIKDGVSSEVTSRTYTKSSGEGGMDQN